MEERKEKGKEEKTNYLLINETFKFIKGGDVVGMYSRSL